MFNYKLLSCLLGTHYLPLDLSVKVFSSHTPVLNPSTLIFVAYKEDSMETWSVGCLPLADFLQAVVIKIHELIWEMKKKNPNQRVNRYLQDIMQSYLSFILMKLIDVVKISLGTGKYYKITFQDKFINDNFGVALIFIQNVLMMFILFFLVRCPHSQSASTVDTNWQIFGQSQLGDK